MNHTNIQMTKSNMFGEVRVMVLNTTFNNISVMSWQSVLLVEENGVPRENHRPAASHWQTWSHDVISSTSWTCLEFSTICKKSEMGITVKTSSSRTSFFTVSTWKINNIYACTCQTYIQLLPLEQRKNYCINRPRH